MSYGRIEDGKDAVVFVTKDDYEKLVDDSSSSSNNNPSGASASGNGGMGAQQEAFNEETGEINWDCPCLGPMVQPPCGDSFKEAFSCFVYSKEEPKGVDCIEQFRAMQA
eukprot:jgi/Hompol1/5119/HPOL_000430-RA